MPNTYIYFHISKFFFLVQECFEFFPSKLISRHIRTSWKNQGIEDHRKISARHICRFVHGNINVLSIFVSPTWDVYIHKPNTGFIAAGCIPPEESQTIFSVGYVLHYMYQNHSYIYIPDSSIGQDEEKKRIFFSYSHFQYNL